MWIGSHTLMHATDKTDRSPERFCDWKDSNLRLTFQQNLWRIANSTCLHLCDHIYVSNRHNNCSSLCISENGTTGGAYGYLLRSHNIIFHRILTVQKPIQGSAGERWGWATPSLFFCGYATVLERCKLPENPSRVRRAGPVVARSSASGTATGVKIRTTFSLSNFSISMRNCYYQPRPLRLRLQRKK
jgi:hypothetical protein